DVCSSDLERHQQVTQVAALLFETLDHLLELGLAQHGGGPSWFQTAYESSSPLGEASSHQRIVRQPCDEIGSVVERFEKDFTSEIRGQLAIGSHGLSCVRRLQATQCVEAFQRVTRAIEEPVAPRTRRRVDSGI